MPDAATIKIRKLDGRKMVGKVLHLKIDGIEGSILPGDKFHLHGDPSGLYRVIKPRRVK